MEYYIGVDGGGTSTRVCAADAAGNILGRFRAGAFNINGQSSARAESTVREIFRALEERGFPAGECAGAGVGAAGISNPEAGRFLRETFSGQGFGGELALYGDHETALAAAFPECHGIILIAGTGSVCYGTDGRGKGFRAGGYGHLIDDGGSAYAIGRDILSAVVRSGDGRAEDTVLTQAVYGKLGCKTVEELVGFVYAPERSKKDLAALAVLLEAAAAGGDRCAREIERRCAEELERLFLAVKKMMPGERNLALAGSVLEKNMRIGSLLKSLLLRGDPLLDVVIPDCDSSEGALRLFFRRKGGHIG